MARKSATVFLWLGLVAGASLPTATRAAPQPILFILDVSGSMAQKLGEETKMQAAKRVFGRLLSELPPESQVGLEVYGHFGDKDCSAIEIARPVGPLDADRIRAGVSALAPSRGATPIAAALETAAEAFPAVEGRKTIVLISDGEETCGGDPVAVARRLEGELGIGLVLHVVGLDVNGAERAQLAAIADAGGGHYYAAANASELERSLTEIKEEVAAAAPAVVFEDEFEGDALGEGWEVVNPDEESLLVEDGRLILLLQPGWPTEGTTKNLLLFRGELPPSYEVELEFEPEVIDYPDFRPWETQRVGLVLYASKTDLIELTTSTSGVASGHLLQAAFGKYKRDQWVANYSANLEKTKAQAFRLQKQGHRYTALVRGAKGRWLTVGSVTDLKGKYRPGILAYRSPNARETSASFDRLTIRSLE